jgi:hypothetical protein
MTVKRQPLEVERQLLVKRYRIEPEIVTHARSWLIDRREQAPVTTRCARCDWTFEGTFAKGREAHAKHRRKHK